jgi:hydroxymethylbilane synthase
MTAVQRSFRLGTRGSLLAVAQSRLIRQALQKHMPDRGIEIVTINTRGDRDQKTPLGQINDEDFFSAELDRALLDKEIDFTVHSMKDIGNERPENIHRAAIPVRENPRDVILFRASITDRLRRNQVIRIGSSSARRQHNVAEFLNTALPALGAEPQLQFLPLRGPVDQRIARIADDPDSPEALDGVVLALAGLARLWRDADGRRALQEHLNNARWIVLPLSECPAAPAQGALALECRADDHETKEMLAGLHDPVTASLVQRETDALNASPETMRQALGATAIRHALLGTLLYTRGGSNLSRHIAWDQPDHPAPDHPGAIPWDGGTWQNTRVRHRVTGDLALQENAAVFLAHWHALPETVSEIQSELQSARIWVSGTASWRMLAAQGIWVEGCADNLGFSDITSTLACEVLQLPQLRRWTVLTRRGAEPGWENSGVGSIVATYALDPPDTGTLQTLRDDVTHATDFFWGSIEQYHAVKSWLPGNARHACGAGKTAQALRQAGVDRPLLFPGRKEWRAWLG